MKDRIQEFLVRENKTSSQFAEEIGVQPSSISHIVSGRNRPSLDFVLKMLSKYDSIRSEWLLFGQGSMYRELEMPGLFDNNLKSDSPKIQTEKSNPGIPIEEAGKQVDHLVSGEQRVASFGDSDRIDRIIVFYLDSTFSEYRPK